MERFDGANSRFREARQQAFKAMAEYSSGMTFLTNLLDVTVLVAGGVYAYLGHIDLADLTSYLMFVRFFLVPIHRLTAFTQQFEQGMSGFTRFLDLMEQKPSIVESPNAQELRDVQGKIEIKNVSFGYEEGIDVLKDINLTIEAGKTVALVGSSGGGKTTLCHLIPRFYDVDEGQILVDGHDVRDLTLQSLRASIGLVQQGCVPVHWHHQGEYPLRAANGYRRGDCRGCERTRGSTTSSCPCPINMTPMWENGELSFPVDRSRGFPLPESS